MEIYNNEKDIEEIESYDYSQYEFQRVKVVKGFKNEIKYPTLREYIEQNKNNQVMKAFAHEVWLQSNPNVNVYFGNTYKVLDYNNDSEITDGNLEDLLDLKIEQVILNAM